MLKKRFLGMMTLLVGIMLVFTLTGCDDAKDDPAHVNPQTVTYTGTAGGITYILKITEGSGSRAAYTPQADDMYELTANGKTSTGYVGSFTDGVLDLKPSNSATTFQATISGSSLTNLSGTITWTDSSNTTGPGTFTGSGNGETGKTIVITNFPSNNYNGKICQLILWNTDEGVEQYDLGGFVAFSEVGISGSSLTFSLKQNIPPNYPVWNGSGKYYVVLYVLSDGQGKVFELEEIMEKLEKMFVYNGTQDQYYNIQNATSTISWNDFYDVGDV